MQGSANLVVPESPSDRGQVTRPKMVTDLSQYSTDRAFSKDLPELADFLILANPPSGPAQCPTRDTSGTGGKNVAQMVAQFNSEG